MLCEQYQYLGKYKRCTPFVQLGPRGCGRRTPSRKRAKFLTIGIDLASQSLIGDRNRCGRAGGAQRDRIARRRMRSDASERILRPTTVGENFTWTAEDHVTCHRRPSLREQAYTVEDRALLTTGRHGPVDVTVSLEGLSSAIACERPLRARSHVIALCVQRITSAKEGCVSRCTESP